MTGSIIFLAIVLAIAAALELSNRRHADPLHPLTGTPTRNDTDLTRTEKDLAATATPSARIHPFPTLQLTHRAARHAA